ncbi:MAG: M20 family metallopeptidase [Bacillaceae bacterium]|nr:amidohydrolase [Bacillaceae bacterium]
MTNEEIKRLVDEVKEEVVGWRRHLHAHPELSFQEEKTAQFVYEKLQSFGNLELSRPTKTSVMARLIGEKPGRVVAIRADMDALPIQEENDFEFVSKNPGVMHACGHDGHTAMLLGTAKILTRLRDRIQGEVRFLFQHAEELYPGGAEEMVQAGVLEGVDVVIGTHLWSPLEHGKIGIVYGPMMASPDSFHLRIHGKGGHAGMPHQTVDAIAIGAQVVTNLQYIVSRYVDPIEPLVVSVTQFVAGTTFNVLPGTVEIQGTVRVFDEKLRQSVPQWMERIIKGITEAHGATYEFQYHYGYRPVINDDEVTKVIEETAREVFGDEAVERMKPNTVGEDFSAFLHRVPGSFFYVGAGNKEKGIIYPHHHPRFTIDEDSLEIGVRLFVHAALKLLGQAA